MHRSLNFLIESTYVDDDSHPRGHCLTQDLENTFAVTYTITQTAENWRDVGWRFCFATEGEDYEAIVSYIADRELALLQVSPLRLPNALLRMFGFAPSATQDGLSRRRLEVSDLLRSNSHVVGVTFAFDRLPQSGDERVR